METKQELKIRCDINIRLPKEEKGYYEHQLKEFVSKFSSKKILYVQFGKQDTRGSESITLIDLKHCVPYQKHFYNKYELLGFVVGFNEAKVKGYYSRFEEYLK